MAIKLKRIIYILVLLITTSSLNAEKLKWAADAEGNAPYIFQDPLTPDHLMGFEVDFIDALSKLMNVTPEFIQNQWDGLIPGLYRGDYDIAVNGLEITEDRKSAIHFSKPYYVTYEQIVTLSKNPDYKSLIDLRNKKVGALKNSLAERILLSEPAIKTLTYEGEVNAFEDLKNGRLDAVLVDAPIALYYASWNSDMKLTGQPIGKVLYGAAFRLNDIELLSRVNNAIDLMIESGILREILERWNLWNPLMAEYTDDFEESETKHDKYDYYIQIQIKEISLEQRLVRYLTFMPMIARAALMTVQISVLSMILAIVLGLFIVIIRLYAPVPFSSLAIAFVEFMRGTPLLIQLFFIFYALPSIGIMLSPFLAAVLGLGLNYAAYEAENYRAGFNSVPRGQMEAALALGMKRRQALRFVILPQAFRIVLPPVTNDFISLLKDSSLVSVITLVELTKLYNQLSATYFDYIGTGILIAAVYLLLGLPFVKISRTLENRLLNRNN
ncbi:MAG: ABC transporter permease subunit [Candidatus Kapabacteria bacterium]|nr:ABC transporter permease subunit [Ignavibacteriota bacterium]MCW5885336.1 ABC transporter permease subunit [Candidatus Kapabacteria bacterium]